jgi:hypothetical protein
MNFPNEHDMWVRSFERALDAERQTLVREARLAATPGDDRPDRRRPRWGRLPGFVSRSLGSQLPDLTS